MNKIEYNQNITFYWTKDKPVKSTFKKHMHNGYELLFFIDGDVDYVIGSSVYHLKPFDLLLIKPGTYHQLTPCSDTVYERIVLSFTEDVLPKNTVSSLQEYNEIYRLNTKDNSVCYLFLELLRISNTFSESDSQSALIQTLQLIILQLKYITENSIPSHKNNHQLKLILEYIDNNISQAITVKTLSKKFFVSPSWISHTFNSHFNIGVAKYISHKRILYAQQLIKSNVPPTKVAKLCGYANYSTFYRQYVKFLSGKPKKDK